MIICFDCPDEKKRQLDDAIATGGYGDYAEFILVAISNQLLLHSRVGASTAFVVEPIGARPPRATAGTGARHATHAAFLAANKVGAEVLATGVPEIFRLPTLPPKHRHRVVNPPDDIFTNGESVPVERWIFGQYNRLLPAKASCRAIANLQSQYPDGLELDAAAVQIAREARVLGIALERKDVAHQRDRDERLSTAFPLPTNEEKGIARFANQFVGAVNSHGQLSGLPASLKLIGRADTKKRRILLTDAGWKFASLKNPCIDDEAESPAQKLSPEETQFMVDHIWHHVPQEVSAFRTILALIEKGHATPEALDSELKARVTQGFAASNSFVATQRSGAISRMTDLGLVDRRRDGIRVTYVVTEHGRKFSSLGESRE